MKVTMNLSKEELKHLEHSVESSVVRNLAWFYLFIFQDFISPLLQA